MPDGISDLAKIIITLIRSCEEADLYMILGALNSKIKDFDEDVQFTALDKDEYVTTIGDEK